MKANIISTIACAVMITACMPAFSAVAAGTETMTLQELQQSLDTAYMGHVSANMKGDTIYLRGEVDNQQDMMRLESMAHQVSGANHVYSYLDIAPHN